MKTAEAVNVLPWGRSLTYGECHSRKVGWLGKNQKNGSICSILLVDYSLYV